MRVKELTVSIGPTLNLFGDYIKATASVTVEVAEGDDLKTVEAFAQKAALRNYKKTLSSELRIVTDVEKADSRADLIKMLTKGASRGKTA